MGDDIQELMRLRRLRRQLELPAYLFERYGGRCKGDCERPVAMAATQPESLTCCNLQPSWDKYHETRALERMLTAKIQMDKPPEPIEAPLAERYERTFTGTYVGRKLFEEAGNEQVDGGKTGEVQADHERKATGTDDEWGRW